MFGARRNLGNDNKASFLDIKVKSHKIVYPRLITVYMKIKLVIDVVSYVERVCRLQRQIMQTLFDKTFWAIQGLNVF